jgi:integrase/recombinase XerD
VRGSRLPRGRALQPGEIRSLFAACEDDDQKKPAMAARDAAILALLYGSGLRRAEAVGLELADYDRDAGILKVRGKGNKERLAHLGDASQAALEAWLLVRGEWAGALFVAINKGGKLRTAGMSGQAMLYIARQRPSSMLVPISAPFSNWPATPRSRPPRATIAAVRPQRSARPNTLAGPLAPCFGSFSGTLRSAWSRSCCLSCC